MSSKKFEPAFTFFFFIYITIWLNAENILCHVFNFEPYFLSRSLRILHTEFACLRGHYCELSFLMFNIQTFYIIHSVNNCTKLIV